MRKHDDRAKADFLVASAHRLAKQIVEDMELYYDQALQRDKLLELQDLHPGETEELLQLAHDLKAGLLQLDDMAQRLASR